MNKQIELEVFCGAKEEAVQAFSILTHSILFQRVLNVNLMVIEERPVRYARLTDKAIQERIQQAAEYLAALFDDQLHVNVCLQMISSEGQAPWESWSICFRKKDHQLASIDNKSIDPLIEKIIQQALLNAPTMNFESFLWAIAFPEAKHGGKDETSWGRMLKRMLKDAKVPSLLE